MILHAVWCNKHLFYFSKTINCTNQNLRQITRKVIPAVPLRPVSAAKCFKWFKLYTCKPLYREECTWPIGKNHNILLKKSTSRGNFDLP